MDFMIVFKLRCRNCGADVEVSASRDSLNKAVEAGFAEGSPEGLFIALAHDKAKFNNWDELEVLFNHVIDTKCSYFYRANKHGEILNFGWPKATHLWAGWEQPGSGWGTKEDLFEVVLGSRQDPEAIYVAQNGFSEWNTVEAAVQSGHNFRRRPVGIMWEMMYHYPRIPAMRVTRERPETEGGGPQEELYPLPRGLDVEVEFVQGEDSLVQFEVGLRALPGVPGHHPARWLT